MIPYNSYKLKYQARNLQHIRVARSSSIFGIVPFIDVVYHYIPDGPSEFGIKPTNPLLAGLNCAIRVHYVETLVAGRGRPVPRIINAGELLSAYFREVSGYIDRIRNIERVLKEKRSYIVEDYSLVIEKNKYVVTRTSHLDSWFNILATVEANVKKIGNNKHHLLLFKLPEVLPDIIRIRKDTMDIPSSQIRYWSDRQRYYLLYLWELVKGNHHYQSDIDTAVNIIVQDRTVAVQFNLADIRQWWKKDSHSCELALYAMFVNLRKKSHGDVVEGTENIIHAPASDHDVSTDTPNYTHTDTTDDDTYVAERNTSDYDSAIDNTDADELDLKWRWDDVDGKTSRHGIVENATLRKTDQSRSVATRPAVTAITGKTGGTTNAPVINKDTGHDDYVDTEHMEATFRDLLRSGHLSVAERDRYVKLASTYKNISNPFGAGTLKDLVTIPDHKKTLTPTDFHIPKKDGTIMHQMSESTVSGFTPKYVREVMESDIASMVLNLQKANVFISQYAVTEHSDAVNNYKKYTITLNPIVGKQSTISFTLPAISESGEFVANNTLRRLDNQIGDLPIRKIKPSRVALTSYYGKSFVDRSKKVVSNYGRWITGKLSKAAISAESGITKVIFTTAPLPQLHLPRKYTAIAENISSFETMEYKFNFVYSDRESLYGKSTIDRYETNGNVICAVSKLDKNKYLVVDRIGNVHAAQDGNVTELGSLESIINPGWANAPVEYACIGIYGKSVPVILVLCSLIGLDNVLKKYKIPHRWSDSARPDTKPYEMRVRCNGSSLYVDTRDVLSRVIIGGFYEVRQQLVEYDVSELNKTGVYGYLLETAGIGRHVIKEIGLMDRLFIDPITRDILRDMKEPTDFKDLLVRAAELLDDDNATDEIDPSYMRIRGYERISGFIYNQLIGGMRTHLSAPNIMRSAVSINPTAVWSDLISDEAITLVENSNPIHNLKELETVTFSGQGGRSGETMMASSRLFHKNAVGLFSEATPDSGKVGTRFYLPPNAKLKNIRGVSERYDYDKDTLVSALSTPALIAPGATSMDPKRINLGSIQQTAMVSAVGSKVMPVRTGYEQVIAYRCADRFATMAKMDGTVVSVSNTAIAVEYADGSKHSVPIGVQHGVASGSIIPHTVITDLHVGDRVKTGDAIAWNTGYFKRDYLNKGGCSMVGGVLSRVALIENTDTLEDGSAISEALSRKLSTPSSKNKTLFVNFNTSVRDLVKIGQQVDVDTVLAVIEEGGLDLLGGSDSTLVGLSKLSGALPKAKQKGTVTNISVIYFGDIKDMHPTLAKIAKESDDRMARYVKESGSALAPNGRVYDSIFVNKNKLTENTVAITVYIDFYLDCNVGDKVVYDNALKSIIGRVMSGVNETEDGAPIDALFGYRSVAGRITPCVESNGVTSTTLVAASKRVVEIYRAG